MWASYIWRTQWQDAFYFALDVVEPNRQVMLEQLIRFCGYNPDPTIIVPFCEEWRPVGETDRDRAAEIPNHMIDLLEFAVEWYNHYTLFCGPRIRNAQTTLGEGK